MALQAGTAAPDFTLGAHNTDQKISLASYRGRPTIVSFLPMAFTGG
jgi:peroxiredoxin